MTETTDKPKRAPGGTSAADCCVTPLPVDDSRNEILHFGDGSTLEINAQMREDHKGLYHRAVLQATRRTFPHNNPICLKTHIRDAGPGEKDNQ